MRLISGFMDKIVEFGVDRFIAKWEKKMSMTHFVENGKSFKNLKYAFEEIDITFQQASRPSGNMQEAKVSYSGNHKLYGSKVEVVVRPNGIASALSGHYPCSTLDTTIMTQCVEQHKGRLKNQVTKNTKMGTHYLKSTLSIEHWDIEQTRGTKVLPKCFLPSICGKKHFRGVHAREDIDFNRKQSADMVLDENYFGRIGRLWSIFSANNVWSESMHDKILALGVIFTNFCITMHNLRNEDCEWYKRYRNRLSAIGEDSKRNWNKSEKISQDKGDRDWE